MIQDKRILLVGSQHGDETLGLELFEYIQNEFPELLPNMEYVCANPKAYEKKTRFIDSDMNRSYALNNDPRPYEEIQADALLESISAGQYDYVLDVHTTTTDVGLCLISAAQYQDLIPRFANATSISNIIVIPDSITAHSLIGNMDNTISIECNDALSKEATTLKTLAEFVKNLISDTPGPVTPRNIFYIDSFIDSNEQYDQEALYNFERASNGKYPILSGGKAGRTYRGFWASDKQTISY